MATASTVPAAYVRLTAGRVILGIVLAAIAFVVLDQFQCFQLGEPLVEIEGVGPDGGWVARWLAFCVFLLPTIVGAIFDGYSFSKGAHAIVSHVPSVAKSVEAPAPLVAVPAAGVSQTEFEKLAARVKVAEQALNIPAIQ
jgi:hypothetical protein